MYLNLLLIYVKHKGYKEWVCTLSIMSTTEIQRTEKTYLDILLENKAVLEKKYEKIHKKIVKKLDDHDETFETLCHVEKKGKPDRIQYWENELAKIKRALKKLEKAKQEDNEIYEIIVSRIVYERQQEEAN